MKKVYSMPEIKITSFENEVVVMASAVTVNKSAQKKSNFGSISIDQLN
jgi:hypothetical protein